MIPEDIAAAKQEGKIPDGVSLFFLAENRNRPTIFGILSLCLFTLFIVLLRCYARMHTSKVLRLDDVLALLTMVLRSTSFSDFRTSGSSGPKKLYIYNYVPADDIRASLVC